MWCASSGPLASYGVGVRTGGDDNFPQKVEQVFPRGKSEEDCIIQLTCPMHMHTSSLGPCRELIVLKLSTCRVESLSSSTWEHSW